MKQKPNNVTKIRWDLLIGLIISGIIIVVGVELDSLRLVTLGLVGMIWMTFNKNEAKQE